MQVQVWKSHVLLSRYNHTVTQSRVISFPSTSMIPHLTVSCYPGPHCPLSLQFFLSLLSQQIGSRDRCVELCATVCFGAAVCTQPPHPSPPPPTADLRNIRIRDETHYSGLILALPHDRGPSCAALETHDRSNTAVLVMRVIRVSISA